MVRILLSLPDSLLLDINHYCKTHHYNRSEFIRHAARLLVEKPIEKSYAQFPTSQVNLAQASTGRTPSTTDVQT